MKYCSLGDSCMPSFTLKDLGLKTESYPFDWLNCKAEVVKLCIEDGFKDFLDKSLYSALPQDLWPNSDPFCQHDLYVSHLMVNPLFEKQVFFRHRNPLEIEKDYEYYIRCVDRFKKLLASDEEKIFIKASMNIDLDKSLIDESISLTEFLESHTTNFKVISLKHSVTGTQTFNIQKHKNLTFLELTTIDGSDGGTFYNYTDQTFIRSFFQHIIDEVRKT